MTFWARRCSPRLRIDIISFHLEKERNKNAILQILEILSEIEIKNE